MKVYLAGPMTGYPCFNFPAFHDAAYCLRALGFTVANPAEHDLDTTPAIAYEAGYATGDVSKTRSFDSRAAFCWDFSRIIEADAIVLMEGWERSAGACTERMVAEKTGKLVLLFTHQEAEDPKVVADPVQLRMRVEVAVTPSPKVAGIYARGSFDGLR